MNKSIVTTSIKSAAKATGRGVLLVSDKTELFVKKTGEDTKWSWYKHVENQKARVASRATAKLQRAADKAAREEDATQLQVDEQTV